MTGNSDVMRLGKGCRHSRNYSIDGLTRVVGSYVVNLLQSDLNEAGRAADAALFTKIYPSIS